jgi:DNA-binding FrmR family transcriptional regulator
MDLPEDVRADVQRRLGRIEGQARGIQRMLDEGRECQDVVQQLLALRAAVSRVTAVIVAENLEECLRRGLAAASGDDVRRAKQAVLSLL